jgi:zinc transport system permease protein
MNFFITFFADPFNRTLVAGLVAAVISPLIGVFLVTRRYSFMADALAHISLACVAISIALGGQPIVVAMAGSVFAALVLEQLRTRTKILGESALVIFMSFGLAVAGVISNASEDELLDTLFGSILNVSMQDLLIIVILGISIIGIVALLWKKLLAISIDEELAQTGGIPVKTLNSIFVVLSAITISLSMRVVGTLLTSALVVIPVIAAMQVATSFRRMLILSILFSLCSVIVGLFLSATFALATGGTIVLTGIVIFFLCLLRKHVLA